MLLPVFKVRNVKFSYISRHCRSCSRLLPVPLFDWSLSPYNCGLSIYLSIDVSSWSVYSELEITLSLPFNCYWYWSIWLYIHYCQIVPMFAVGRPFYRSNSDFFRMGIEILCSVLYSSDARKFLSKNIRPSWIILVWSSNTNRFFDRCSYYIYFHRTSSSISWT